MSNHFFKARARLILQLGDQLIKNESVAMLELVKNSYDAFARRVDIQLKDLGEADASITVVDDGEGMSYDLLKDVWLEPGSDYKTQFIKKPRTKNGITRIPLGEKGIGRFSAHKLGNVIELVSRTAGRKEVSFKINWADFGKSEKKYFQDVPINLVEHDQPTVFKGEKTGTKIVIRQLRNEWTRRSLRELYRAVNSMCYPFESSDRFIVDFKLDDEEILKGLLSFRDIKKYALYSFDIEMEGDRFVAFSYKFQPWKTMSKVTAREVTLDSDQIQKRSQMKKQILDEKTRKKTSVLIDLAKYKIGRVRFHGFIFDRQRKTLELGVQDKQGLKEYLDDNGGVRIYRDGIRVYDYGEKDNDWLNLSHRRVDDPGYKVSEKLILAAVQLDRKSSEDLVEMTNREGFIESKAYEVFVDAVTYGLGVVESLRSIDKEIFRNAYGATPKGEPVVEKVSQLKEIIRSKIKDEALRAECLGQLDRIEEDYKTIRKVLLTNAESGLHLSVAIHEIEKIISELKTTVSKENVSPRVLRLVRHLADLVDRYSSILRDSKVKAQSLKTVINDALFYVNYRLDVHGVEIVKNYLDFPEDPQVDVAANLVMGAILNIVDNSIFWLDYYEVTKKRIFIALQRERHGAYTVIIADNGLGFNMPTEFLCRPFMTSKPGGIGLGLHIASEIMNAQGGALLFPNVGDYKIPKPFEKGAVIALTFKAA